MAQLLQYRFGGTAAQNGAGNAPDGAPAGNTLRGHAFGNLLLAALTGITGSFDEALLAAQRVLAIRGQVLPSTLENITLMAEVIQIVNGKSEVAQVSGESAIPEAGGRIERVWLQPQAVAAYPPALRAIFDADLIILGPGSLYTSILPNLLIPDLAEAMRYTHAPKVYVCNLATQPGETEGYTVRDHVKAIAAHLPANFLNAVLANNNLTIPPETGGGQTHFVQPVPPAGIEMIATDLVDEQRPWRHDSQKLAQAVMAILESYRVV
jgi:uncharacterized cofD-like protein